MFNILYWVTFFVFGLWGLGGAFAFVDSILKGNLVGAIFIAIFTFTPLVLLILKKPWMKTKWSKMFGSHKAEARAEAKEQRNTEKAFYCMQILTYVAVSDKDLATIDKEIIVEFMRSIFSESQTAEAIKKLDEWGSTAKLSELDLNYTLSKINKQCTRDERRKIVDACSHLIRADGHIDDIESSVFGLIRKTIYPMELGGLLSTKCENCKSSNCKTVSKSEIDRWIARKNVTEKLASGKVRTKNVAITKVKIQYKWICSDCNNEWTTTETLEKN